MAYQYRNASVDGRCGIHGSGVYGGVLRECIAAGVAELVVRLPCDGCRRFSATVGQDGVMAIASGSVPDLVRVVDLTGVFANALLGGAVARRHGFDPVGFAALAIVSGLGGGLIRDTLLQRGTPVALTNYAYLTTALIGAAVAFAVRFEGRLWERLFPFVDALALGCWAAAGAQKPSRSGWVGSRRCYWER